MTGDKPTNPKEPVVEMQTTLSREVTTVQRPWGSYSSLETGEGYQVKRINVHPGQRLSLQSHHYRCEHWVVVKGSALVTVGEEKIELNKGESAFIPAGAKHRMESIGVEPLEVIEVQNGSYLGEDDIQRYEDDYGRSAPDPALQCYRDWLAESCLDYNTRRELAAMEGNMQTIQDHFGTELEFGTAGMRGVMGPGINRINPYIVRRATQGLANYINSANKQGSEKRVALAYDTRRLSREFALEAALVLAANGIKALLFTDVRPTPELSFAIRELNCEAGIVVTASHNPPTYNGYKVYGPDGGQAVSPFADELVAVIKQVHIFRDVKTMQQQEAEEKGLLQLIDAEVDKPFKEAVRSLALSSPREKIKVVYTPLHGTGAALIPALLREKSFVQLSVVEEQMVADPDFSTVKSPNPEEPASFEMAINLARREGADLIMATDPDADRVGCAVKQKDGSYLHLTGNQTGALLLEYLLSRMSEDQKLPERGVMVKTIVTGELGRKIASSYGVETEETLTGFKFIGEKIREYEETKERSYIFGYEESYGYLAGTFARDKDAVGAACLIAEMAAYYKEQGKSLPQLLQELSAAHGYFKEGLVSIVLNNMAEAGRFMQAFSEFPKELNGVQVVEKRDYEQGLGFDLLHGQEYKLTLPVSEVLYYTFADESWFCVRPSGTEPKVKIYFAVRAESDKEAVDKLSAFKEAVLAVPGIKV